MVRTPFSRRLRAPSSWQACRLRCVSAASSQPTARLGPPAKGANSATRVHEYMKIKPVVSIGDAARNLGLTRPTISAALGRLESLGMAHEPSPGGRPRLYAYRAYVALLAAGTGPTRPTP